MKLLIDANLSPRVATTLGERGYEATHVGEIGLLSASDTTIMPAAVQLGAAVETADTDFPMLLALAGHKRPSIVLLRRIHRHGEPGASACTCTPDQLTDPCSNDPPPEVAGYSATRT